MDEWWTAGLALMMTGLDALQADGYRRAAGRDAGVEQERCGRDGVRARGQLASLPG